MLNNKKNRENSGKTNKDGFYMDGEIAKRIGLCTCMVGTIVALGANSSLVGLIGVAKGIVIGAGTGFGATVGAVALGLSIGACMTTAAFAIVHVIKSKVKDDEKIKKIINTSSTIAATGMVVGAVVGYVAGGIAGYNLSKDFLIKKIENKKINPSFNGAVSGKKVEIDRKKFVATIKTPKPSF